MEVEDFFEPQEWEILVDYEKTRISNTYDKYRKMKGLGLDPNPPDFILNYNKRKRDPSQSFGCDAPPAKKSLIDDEAELRLSQELEELLQVSQDNDAPSSALGEKIAEKDSEPLGVSELNIPNEIPIKDDIQNDKKRVTRSSRKKLGEGKAVQAENSYSLRSSARNKYYHEYSSPEEDDYEFCDECLSEYLDGCPLHGLLKQIPDAPANVDKSSNEEYARRTIPLGLVVAPSAIKNAGLGVWTTKPIPGGSRFGPYKGTMVSNPGTGDYAWEIKYRGKCIKPKFVDGSDVTKSNWMRYVNSARNFTEQNLVAYQYQKKIYYRVPFDVPENKELYVYYGKKYTQDLGIDARQFFEPPKIPLEVETFTCNICEKNLSSPVERDYHMKTSVCKLEPEESSRNN